MNRSQLLRMPSGWALVLGWALAVMVAVTAVPVCYAAPSGVDLSRVKLAISEVPVTIEMGEIEFHGKLRQEAPFDQEAINKLVRLTLQDKGVTQLELIEAQRAIEQAREASNFTQKDIERIKDNLLKSAKVVPQAEKVHIVLSNIHAFMSTSTWSDVGVASGALLEQGAVEWVKETAFGQFDSYGDLRENLENDVKWIEAVSNVQEFCSMMMDEYDRTYLKWQAIAKGANAKRLVNDFYSQLMDRIDNYRRTSIEKGWFMRFDMASDGRNIKFFGSTGNYQTWYLDMRLKQVTRATDGSAQGDYVGNYVLRAEHSLAGFLSPSKSDLEAIIANLPSLKPAYSGLVNGGFKVTATASHSGDQFISRVQSGTARVAIASNGDMTLALEPSSDQTSVGISGYEIAFKINTFTSVVKGDGIFEFELGAKKEDLAIVKGSADLSLIAPDFAKNSKNKGVGYTSQGWEKSLWEVLQQPLVIKKR